MGNNMTTNTPTAEQIAEAVAVVEDCLSRQLAVQDENIAIVKTGSVRTLLQALTDAQAEVERLKCDSWLVALTSDLKLLRDRAETAEAENARLQAEVERLNERLENNRVWVASKDGPGFIRQDVEPGSIPDGIECRDETIRQQDRNNDALRAENAWLRVALTETLKWAVYESEYDGKTYKICQSCEGRDGKHRAHCELPALRALSTTKKGHAHD
jgi:regulator of replication initiation timing